MKKSYKIMAPDSYKIKAIKVRYLQYASRLRMTRRSDYLMMLKSLWTEKVQI